MRNSMNVVRFRSFTHKPCCCVLTILLLSRCVVNCKKKTAVTSPLSFSVTCSTCSDTDMLDADYTWSLALYTNVTGQYDVLPDSASYFLQSGQSEFWMQSHSFSIFHSVSGMSEFWMRSHSFSISHSVTVSLVSQNSEWGVTPLEFLTVSLVSQNSEWGVTPLAVHTVSLVSIFLTVSLVSQNSAAELNFSLLRHCL